MVATKEQMSEEQQQNRPKPEWLLRLEEENAKNPPPALEVRQIGQKDSEQPGS